MQVAMTENNSGNSKVMKNMVLLMIATQRWS